MTSVGYCFFEKRKRLKDEFKGKSGRELGQLRKDGVELNEEVSLPHARPHTHTHAPHTYHRTRTRLADSGVSIEFKAELPYMAFLGDTTGKVLVDHGKLLRYHPASGECEAPGACHVTTSRLTRLPISIFIMSIARTRWCSSSAPSSSPTTRTPRRAANTSTGGTVDLIVAAFVFIIVFVFFMVLD